MTGTEADPDELRRQARRELEQLDESAEMEARLEAARDSAEEVEVPESTQELPAADDEIATGLEHSEDEGEAAGEAGQ